MVDQRNIVGVDAQKLLSSPKTIDYSGMVLIPSGTFEMGGREMDNEQPIHTVEVPTFYMDVSPVTVGQYRQFVEETGYKTPNWRDILIDSPTDDHPIIYVNWHDAMAYTQWVEKRLPTEAEWEYAARGGLDQAEFPWPNSDVDPHNSSEYANYYGTVRQTNVGGTYPVNGYALNDMAGNVWEWCLDAYAKEFYVRSPQRSPLAIREDETDGNLIKRMYRVIRGGSWNNYFGALRVAFRGYQDSSCDYDYNGFRCVCSVV